MQDSFARHVARTQRGLCGAANPKDHDLGRIDLEHNAVKTSAAGFEKRLSKFATQRMGFRSFSKTFRCGLDLIDGAAKCQIPGNRAWNGTPHQPMEDVVHVGSGALDDAKCATHDLAGSWCRLRNSRSNSSNGIPLSPLAMSSSASWIAAT